MDLEFLGEAQREFLKGSYHLGQTIEERFDDIINRIREYEDLGYPQGLADRMKDYVGRGVVSLSTPTITNFGGRDENGKLKKNLPASCNIITLPNSIHGIYSANLELAMLSKRGAGTAVDVSKLPEEGTKLDGNFNSNSRIDWIEAMVDTSQKVSQNATRRGYCAPFLSIDAPEYFKLMDKIDKNITNQDAILIDNTIGINISDGFMERLSNKDKDAQKRWLRLLEARKETGDVYIVFEGNMNKNCSPVYTKLGQYINLTNMCVECSTPSYEDKTFVCVLAAHNLEHWDEIKNNKQIIWDVIFFCDILNEEYIKLGSLTKGIERAVRSAKEKRDIGIGTLGFHSLLQSKGLAFGDIGSRALNKEIYKTIQEESIKASEYLAETLGAAPMCVEAGINRRNVSLNMIAPNKSTSFLQKATSPGIEPYFSNVFTKRLAKIQHVSKNPHLTKVLEKYNKNTDKIWESISKNLGSVSHLDFLSKEEKDVFLTFAEISPKDIIDLAADRQEYIDMSQSLNLVNRPNYDIKDLHKIHKYAYDKGIKTLYYFYPQAHSTLEMEGKNWDSCVSCAD